MMDTASAKIYLANERGCTQSPSYRSFHTFNFGTYGNPHREPFFALKTFNDETLASGATSTYAYDMAKEVIIIPLAGELVCKTNASNIKVDAGQALQSCVKQGDRIEVFNHFKEELINYLYIEFNGATDSHDHKVAAFEIEKEYNKLHHIGLSGSQNIFIGIYDGREESSLTFDTANKQFFAFVIEGAFEVNNRLLHKRDALALWNTSQIEFEALSNHAIILVIDVHP